MHFSEDQLQLWNILLNILIYWFLKCFLAIYLQNTWIMTLSNQLNLQHFETYWTMFAQGEGYSNSGAYLSIPSLFHSYRFAADLPPHKQWWFGWIVHRFTYSSNLFPFIFPTLPKKAFDYDSPHFRDKPCHWSFWSSYSSNL